MGSIIFAISLFVILYTISTYLACFSDIKDWNNAYAKLPSLDFVDSVYCIECYKKDTKFIYMTWNIHDGTLVFHDTFAMSLGPTPSMHYNLWEKFYYKKFKEWFANRLKEEDLIPKLEHVKKYK